MRQIRSLSADDHEVVRMAIKALTYQPDAVMDSRLPGLVGYRRLRSDRAPDPGNACCHANLSKLHLANRAEAGAFAAQRRIKEYLTSNRKPT
jgi:hypothetical protein